MRLILFRSLAFVVSFGRASLADDTSATPAGTEKVDRPGMDKSQYSFFNPTPREYLREMNTDRPDKTESPFTVDAGHFQIEMDLVSYTHDRQDSDGAVRRTDAWAIAPFNLKVGLCNRADLQVALQTWNEVETSARGPGRAVRQHSRGLGDLTIRMKYNFWGDDGGPTAFGAIPFVKLPTSQDKLGNNRVEGGLIFPLAVELPRGFGMGLMTELDVNRDNAGKGYHFEFVNSITFSHDLVGRLAGYVEFFSAASSERDADWVGTADLGLTYGLTENVQLDAGVNFGVTKSADDVNAFAGLSWRF